MIIIPLIPGAFYLADPIITFICGGDFAPGGPALQILVFAAGAQMINIFFVPLYIALNEQRRIVHFQVVGLVMNVTLNLILIPILSFIGAAIATVATEAVILLLIFLWMRKRLALSLFPPAAYTAKVIACTMMMMFFVIFAELMNVHVLLIIMGAIIVYLVALLATKTIDVAEMKKMVMEKSAT